MRVLFDRAEYIRYRAELLNRPEPAQKIRAKVRRPDHCGCGRIPDAGYRKCAGCRALRKSARAERIAEGLCAQARSHGPAAPGGLHCAACREHYRVLTAARRLEVSQ